MLGDSSVGSKAKRVLETAWKLQDKQYRLSTRSNRSSVCDSLWEISACGVVLRRLRFKLHNVDQVWISQMKKIFSSQEAINFRLDFLDQALHKTI